MIVSLILLGVLVVVGALLYTEHRLHLRKSGGVVEPEAEPQAEECCGMHVTCEKDSLLASVSREIEYYDDEELDRFAGRASTGYTEAESEEFRDILLSMRPDDIAGWARSLQLRQIALPSDVRDELLLIVSEARAAKTKHDVAIS